jgi:hypothetical protein
VVQREVWYVRQQQWTTDGGRRGTGIRIQVVDMGEYGKCGENADAREGEAAKSRWEVMSDPS